MKFQLKEKKVKVSLKRENEILKEMGKYLFGLVTTMQDSWEYYIKKEDRLEKQIRLLKQKLKEIK